MIMLGVLECAPQSEWIHGTFIVSRKDASTHWISDLHSYIMSLICKVNQIPKITELLYKCQGYKYITMTILDLSDHYYTFVIKENCHHILTTATPFGLGWYKQLPQGISISPDITQEAMESLLCEFLEWVICYFNDIALFSNSWEDHVYLINKVCTIIKKARFKVNPNKCDWAKQEVEFLGYLITPNGLKPLWSKINMILAMKKPKNLIQL